MNRMSQSIEFVWRCLKELEGQPFETKTGKPFTFTIEGDVLRPNRTDYNISKAEFQKALDLIPCNGPGDLNRSVRGPAYVWAILHDPRVRPPI